MRHIEYRTLLSHDILPLIRLIYCVFFAKIPPSTIGPPHSTERKKPTCKYLFLAFVFISHF